MHQLKGVGLPNVRLASGYRLEGEGDDQTVSYCDVEGLYRALALAVSCRGANLTPAEFRFLRRRLDKSQQEVGAFLDVKDQTVAKWEKGQLPVPVASAALLKLAWLGENAPEHMARTVAKRWNSEDFVCHGYVFAYEAGKWVDRSHSEEFRPIQAQAERETAEVIATCISASTANYASTVSFSSTIREVRT